MSDFAVYSFILTAGIFLGIFLWASFHHSSREAPEVKLSVDPKSVQRDREMAFAQKAVTKSVLPKSSERTSSTQVETSSSVIVHDSSSRGNAIAESVALNLLSDSCSESESSSYSSSHHGPASSCSSRSSCSSKSSCSSWSSCSSGSSCGGSSGCGSS